MKKQKVLDTVRYTIGFLILICIVNAAITSIIDRFKHQTLTETQILVRMPQTFFWNFNLSE